MKQAWWIVIAVMLPIEGRADHRFLFDPSLQMSAVEDNNLNFSIDAPLRDRVSRITPMLALRFDSPRWRVRSTYSVDSEQYAKHSALNSDRARERAAVSLQYQAGPRLILSMNHEYVDTNTLADLNVDTGLAASRVRGRQLSFNPSATFRISPRLTATASAASVVTTVVNGVGTRLQEQSFGLEQRVTPRDRFMFDYAHSRVVFPGSQAALSVNANTLLAGWARELGTRDRLVLQVGPRVSNGSRLLDVSASLMRRWRQSSIALSLLQSQTTVNGSAGVVDTQSVQAKFSFTASRKLTAYAAPAILRNTQGRLEGTVYRLALGAHYAVTPFLRADMAYSHDAQQGAIDPVLANARFSHSTLSVGFTTSWNDPDKVR